METGQSAFFGGFMFSGKPLDYQDEPLTDNGFWPDLNLKDFQAQRSLPPDIDADTISQASGSGGGGECGTGKRGGQLDSETRWRQRYRA
ncbi:hypothetical protein ACVXHA_27135 [Escherichia coli]